jgi:hypothetical protein
MVLLDVLVRSICLGGFPGGVWPAATLPAVDSARLAAPEIDRLVLAVNRGIGEGNAALARAAGLEGPGLIKHYADWLLTVGLQREVAVARLPYARAGAVDAWIDELIEAGLIEQRDGRLFAADGLVPLATAILDVRSKAANAFWRDQGEPMEAAITGARQIADAAPGQFVVGVAHREVPEPDDRALALHQRLVTLRYLRSQCHVEAWTEAGLAANEIVSMTALWHHDRTAGIPGSLVQRGFVYGTELTEEGDLIRGEIEYVTNQRTQQLFDALADPEGFVAALKALPSVDEDD